MKPQAKALTPLVDFRQSLPMSQRLNIRAVEVPLVVCEQCIQPLINTHSYCRKTKLWTLTMEVTRLSTQLRRTQPDMPKVQRKRRALSHPRYVIPPSILYGDLGISVTEHISIHSHSPRCQHICATFPCAPHSGGASCSVIFCRHFHQPPNKAQAQARRVESGAHQPRREG